MIDLFPLAQSFKKAIDERIFSGAQIAVGRGTQSIFQASYGTVSNSPDSPPIAPHTLFDIASLTKPVATATLAMIAVEEGRLDPEAGVEAFLPKCRRAEQMTVRELLQHTSGLPAWLPLFEEAVNKGWTYEETREFFVARIAKTPLTQRPGEKRVYSDLGFILLGFILESLYALRLSPLFQEKVALPLGLTRTLFNPLNSGISRDGIAATEACPWRGRLLQGEVHDDNAWVLGGACGHAGLFASAGDLEKFLHFLIKILGGESGIVSRRTMERFVGPKVFPKWGWDTVSRPHSQAGSYFSEEGIGHLAFTGCSLWADLSDGKYVIMNTNRVHPSRDNEGIKEFRPRVHDLAIRVLGLK